MKETPTRTRGRLFAGASGLWAAGGLVALAALASLWPEPFRLDRAAVEAGEVWRLVTGHLVHATWAHFFFDVGVGCVLLCLIPLRWTLAVLPLFVGGAVLLVRPDLAWYDGLSGVLHGWTVLAAWHVFRGGDRLERAAALVLLLGVTGKAFFEAALGISLFTHSFDMGAATVFEAHAAGVVGGLLAVCISACVAYVRDAPSRGLRPASAEPAVVPPPRPRSPSSAMRTSPHVCGEAHRRARARMRGSDPIASPAAVRTG